VFGLLVIWLNTNQYATGLALSLFGVGFSAFAGIKYVQEKLPERPQFSIPVLGDIPLVGPALFRQHPLVYLTTVPSRMGLIWFLYRTRAGLVLRSVGESPESAHALGYPVRRIRLAAVVVGGALCGLAGAYISVVYTPLWVEGMVAGKGWIALALTTFATWRPARVLLGAYLFGGVTMLQFHLQGVGVDVPSQLLTHAALCGHHRGAGADLAQPGLDPGQHAGVAGQALPSRFITGFRFFSTHPCPERADMTDLHKRSLLKVAALTAVAALPWWAAARRKSRSRPRRPPAAVGGGTGQARAAEDRLCLCRPGGRRRLDLCARQRPQGGREGIRRQGRDLLRRERARVGRRRARDPRHGGPGQQADLRHHLRLHGAHAQGRRRQQGREVRACHRLQEAENMRTYDSRTYEGAYMAGVIAGKMTKTNTLGVVGSIPIPEVIRNINSFTLGAQSVNPKVKTKVVWVNEVVQPAQGNRSRHRLINGGADVLFQNTDSSAVLQTAEKNGQARLRLGFSDMTAYGPKAHLARPSSTGVRTTSRPWATRWKASGPPARPGGA
jgi:hypothetical protein